MIGPVCGAWIAELGDWRWVVSAPVLEQRRPQRLLIYDTVLGPNHRQCRGPTSRALPSPRKCVLTCGPTHLWLSTAPFFAAYAPVLLEQKARLVKDTMDMEKGQYCEVRTIFDGADREYVCDSLGLWFFVN